MTEIELKRIVTNRFAQAGLLPYLSERQQQCLELEDSFFVEIVLKDASKLGAAQDRIEELRTELASQNVRIESVVRALWEVKDVEHVGAPRAESGGIKSAERFHAYLESCTVKQLVEVDLSHAAIQELKSQIEQQELKGRIEQVDRQSLETLVKNFLKLQLSTGGTSYWDPIRYRHQDIGPMAILYLLHHSPMTAA